LPKEYNVNVPVRDVSNTPINKPESVPCEYAYWAASITSESVIKAKKNEQKNQRYFFMVG
jgi:hypothetical protein